MNHQPFRDWLLSDEKLSADQTQALQEHLHSCEPCSQLAGAWTEVELSFRQSPQLSPAPGFTTRWQAHLDEYLQHKQRQRVWLSMVIMVISVTALLVILVSQVWTFVQSPGDYLAVWFNSLISLVAIYYALADKFQSITGYMPVYTFIGMFFLVGIISFMSVLWLATYKKISMVRRAV